MAEFVGTIPGMTVVVALLWVLFLCAQLIWSAIAGPRDTETEADFDAQHCENCGYDLRGSGDRCPECGTLQDGERRYRRALATEWPDAPIAPVAPKPSDLPVQLGSLRKDWEAELIVQQLNARGVWAGAESDLNRRRKGLPNCIVLVPQSEMERAKVIVDAFRRKAEPVDGTEPMPDSHDGRD